PGDRAELAGWKDLSLDGALAPFGESGDVALTEFMLDIVDRGSPTFEHEGRGLSYAGVPQGGDDKCREAGERDDPGAHHCSTGASQQCDHRMSSFSDVVHVRTDAAKAWQSPECR